MGGGEKKKSALIIFHLQPVIAPGAPEMTAALQCDSVTRRCIRASCPGCAPERYL